MDGGVPLARRGHGEGGIARWEHLAEFFERLFVSLLL
jgi:hypothetical protein